MFPEKEALMTVGQTWGLNDFFTPMFHRSRPSFFLGEPPERPWGQVMFEENEKTLAEQQDLGWTGSACSLEKRSSIPASLSVNILMNNNKNKILLHTLYRSKPILYLKRNA